MIVYVCLFYVLNVVIFQCVASNINVQTHSQKKLHISFPTHPLSVLYFYKSLCYTLS
jgi:hypothetical protein